MDLSKLQKLSGEARNEPASSPEPGNPPPANAGAAGAPAGPLNYAAPRIAEGEIGAMVAEVWISAILGLVLLYLGRSFGGWLFAAVQGREYDTGVRWVSGPQTGQPVPYWQIVNHEALSDSAVFLFGLALLTEAIVLGLALARPAWHRRGLGISMVILLLATLYNLLACAVLMGDGVLPQISAIAVAAGGYILVMRWFALRRLGNDHQA